MDRIRVTYPEQFERLKKQLFDTGLINGDLTYQQTINWASIVADRRVIAALHTRYIKEIGLHSGDLVRVVHKVPGYYAGWEDVWSSTMDDLIGLEFMIDRIYGSNISLTCGYNFPFFALQKIAGAIDLADLPFGGEG